MSDQSSSHIETNRQLYLEYCFPNLLACLPSEDTSVLFEDESDTGVSRTRTMRHHMLDQLLFMWSGKIPQDLVSQEAISLEVVDWVFSEELLHRQELIQFRAREFARPWWFGPAPSFPVTRQKVLSALLADNYRFSQLVTEDPTASVFIEDSFDQYLPEQALVKIQGFVTPEATWPYVAPKWAI